METEAPPGRIVILNGAPRAGKSSIVAAIQETFDGVWLNLGVDAHSQALLPARLRPGIGLRPGGERPDLEPLVQVLYAGLYEAVAAQSRLGLNVVMDVGHHDAYARSRGILADCARRLGGLPVLFVGVRCPMATILERRAATGYLTSVEGQPIPAPVLQWQEETHRPGLYDLEVDTSRLSPAECATAISRALESEPATPTAFQRLAARPQPL